MNYSDFLERKRHTGAMHGFEPLWMPDFLFDFQRSLVEWAIRKGRAAIFADCGLGKTPMQLVWAENVARHTGRRVLIATPLAVAHQTVREAEKFGIECAYGREGLPEHGRIVVTNYERLHYFQASDFVGMVCDESSILKNFDGARRQSITNFMRKLPYRLLCTATAAPNDYTELGTSSEALGELGHMDMLTRFFKSDQNNSQARRRYGKVALWRFKGHAEPHFWRWVCSWARTLRRPSDLGFDDDGFVLTPLEERTHVIKAREPRPDLLFDLPAVGLREERFERRRTIAERCEKIAELANGCEQVLIWCHLNPEGDLLSRIIPDAEQVAGSDSDDDKERRLLAFAAGELRCLVTKPKIAAWGLNLQNCSRIALFPSHSYEQYYQAIRRCWRFGQKRPVVVDIVSSEAEAGVAANLQRKAAQADRMFSALVAHVKDAAGITESRSTIPTEVPTWLR